MNDRTLRLKNVSHSYGSVPAVRNISMTIGPGEFIAIVGPSGCGKTTLLNILSGFIKPSSGAVAYTGRARTVYQHDGLFPWLTVVQNVVLGLQHLEDESERRRQLAEMIRFIRLEGFERHYPHQLSGGMRQRVELARALAGDTDLLLMDEPFSSLDYLTRLRLRRELALMLREQPRTVILVTHDIEEATQLADRVIVLSGRPASIQHELQIDVPRPRDLTHPEVVDAMQRVLGELGIEQDIENVLRT